MIDIPKPSHVPDAPPRRAGRKERRMRLIDADKVISLWDKYHYSIATHAIEFDEELRKLSTVEAVPISFIEEMKAWAEENDFALYASDLNHLLLTWAERKEE